MSNFHTNTFVRRSSLIFPINIPRFVEKAFTRGADCCVMDLEDSVPDSEKASARSLIKESIPIVAKGGGDVSVRINQDIKLARKDLEASVWPGLSCVSLPKVESAEEVKIRDQIISELEEKRGIQQGSIQIGIAVETALGVLSAFQIAKSSQRIVSIGVGAEDLTREMGVPVTAKGDELWYARSKILVDAYAAGVQPFGLIGVEPFSWRDPEKILEAASYSRGLGFKGSNSIHPVPIPHLNSGFSIPKEEADYAERALNAFDEGLRRGTASVNVDGRMVDIATVERCKIILERFQAIASIEEKKSRALKGSESVEEKMRKAIEKAENIS